MESGTEQIKHRYSEISGMLMDGCAGMRLWYIPLWLTQSKWTGRLTLMISFDLQISIQRWWTQQIVPLTSFISLLRRLASFHISARDSWSGMSLQAARRQRQGEILKLHRCSFYFKVSTTVLLRGRITREMFCLHLNVENWISQQPCFVSLHLRASHFSTQRDVFCVLTPCVETGVEWIWRKNW